MNLLPIELSAVLNKVAYVIKLFASVTNPFASAPRFLTIYGDKKKLIAVVTPIVAILATIFKIFCLPLLNSRFIKLNFFIFYQILQP